LEARSFAENNLSWQIIASKTNELYNTVLT